MYSPWHGAIWERLMKVVKDCLYKTIGRQITSMSHFCTVISDIILVINNRPLTYRSRDNELDVITPNHFLSHRNSFPSLVLSEESELISLDDDYLDHEQLSNTLDYRDANFSKFKQIWHEQYLLSLRDFHKNSYDPKEYSHKYLKVGSIVLLRNTFRARPYWSLVKIIELLPGKDGNIRVVRIQRHDGAVTTASVSHLYPLELEIKSNSPISDKIDDTYGDLSDIDEADGELVGDRLTDVDVSVHYPLNDAPNSNAANRRPIRRSAEQFNKNLAAWISDDLL